LSVYSSIDDFLRSVDRISLKTIICIDSNLGDKVNGEEEAREIYDRGFLDIYLVTGKDKNSVNDYPWIKAIVGKAPVWFK
jgi:hypothetical protein